MVNRRQLLKLSALGTTSFAAPLAYSASKMTTTYNTGNPVGSTFSEDLRDNAQSLDFFVNGPNPSYPDRLGVLRKTWKGMEGEFDADQTRRESEFDADQNDRERNFTAFMDASGFEPPVPYAPGLNLVRITQTVTYLGNEYRIKSQFLPLTATNWATDEPKLKMIGDYSLRQDLANSTDLSKGAGMSAWKISKLARSIESAKDALDHLEVPLWSFADRAIGYSEGGDPSTWDWGPAISAADRVIDTLSACGGCIVARAGVYGIGSQATLTGLGKGLKGHGIRATEFRALAGYTGDIIVYSGSSYCKAEHFKIVGSGGATQRGIYMPYRPDVAVTLSNRINCVHVERVAEGIALENAVHCTITDVHTTRDCTLFGLRSQFIAGVGVGQGGTNLRLIGGWYQAHETTGTSVYVNSNTNLTSIGTQFENGRFGLVMRACPGVTLVSPFFEDCGLHLTLQGCTNVMITGATLDSGTSPDLGVVVQALIDLDGGSGIKIFGLYSGADDKSYIDALIRFSNGSYGKFPDDVLIDTYKSYGGKGLSGTVNATRLRVINAGAMALGGAIITGARVQLPILTAAPMSPALGEEFNADGVSWRPTTGGRARVIYSGSGVYTKITNF